jgi:hypothetical protein
MIGFRSCLCLHRLLVGTYVCILLPILVILYTIVTTYFIAFFCILNKIYVSIELFKFSYLYGYQTKYLEDTFKGTSIKNTKPFLFAELK